MRMSKHISLKCEDPIGNNIRLSAPGKSVEHCSKHDLCPVDIKPCKNHSLEDHKLIQKKTIFLLLQLFLIYPTISKTIPDDKTYPFQFTHHPSLLSTSHDYLIHFNMLNTY
jgi:hypothetical protein